MGRLVELPFSFVQYSSNAPWILPHIQNGDHINSVSFFIIIYCERKALPKLAEGYFYRGLALAAQGQFGRASGDFSRAIQLKPAELRYYVARGEAFLLAGQCGEALKDFEEAMALDAEWSRGWELRARANCCLGKVDQAQADEE